MLDWSKYIEIADKFQYKAKPEDREDLRQDIILRLAEVEAKYNGNGNGLTEGGMVRVASFVVMAYWRDYYRTVNGFDCGRCSNQQRKRCKDGVLYAKCPKAITINSLNKPIVDEDGNITELWQVLADDKAVDLEAWLDAKLWLYRAPARLVNIAYKKVNGLPLADSDRHYLERVRKNGQKRLF